MASTYISLLHQKKVGAHGGVCKHWNAGVGCRRTRRGRSLGAPDLVSRGMCVIATCMFTQYRYRSSVMLRFALHCAGCCAAPSNYLKHTPTESLQNQLFVCFYLCSWFIILIDTTPIHRHQTYPLNNMQPPPASFPQMQVYLTYLLAYHLA